MRHRNTDDTVEHTFTFIVPTSLIKILSVSQRFSDPKTFFKTWANVKLDIFGCKKTESILCIVFREVFLLRAVLFFFLFYFFCKLTEGGNGLCLPHFPLISFHLRAHNNKHCSNPAQSLGRIIVS